MIYENIRMKLSFNKTILYLQSLVVEHFTILSKLLALCIKCEVVLSMKLKYIKSNVELHGVTRLESRNLKSTKLSLLIKPNLL